MSDRVLIVSPDGMLGAAWAALLTARGIAFDAVSYPAFDLTADASVDAVPWSQYDRVINCSAWTDVDGAEAREAEATAINGDGVARLAERCARRGATLVHYSTDYVFDGRGSVPYRVDHPRAPISAYGRSKAAGEERLLASGAHHLLVRTSWLYAPWGKNFVLTMMALARQRDVLRVVDDQRGRPTSAEHLARTSLDLLQAGVRGTFHVCDGGECTWYELARRVVERVRPACTVQPCSTAEFPRPAQRPPYSVLDLSEAERVLGRAMPPWQDHVDDVVARAM